MRKLVFAIVLLLFVILYGCTKGDKDAVPTSPFVEGHLELEGRLLITNGLDSPEQKGIYQMELPEGEFTRLRDWEETDVVIGIAYDKSTGVLWELQRIDDPGKWSVSAMLLDSGSDERWVVPEVTVDIGLDGTEFFLAMEALNGSLWIAHQGVLEEWSYDIEMRSIELVQSVRVAQNIWLNGLTLNREGTLFAVGLNVEGIPVYDTKTGAQILELEGRYPLFHNTKNALFYLSPENIIMEHSLDTGATREVFACGEKGAWSRCAISPDGEKLLLTAWRSDNFFSNVRLASLYIVEIETGKAMTVLEGDYSLPYKIIWVE